MRSEGAGGTDRLLQTLECGYWGTSKCGHWRVFLLLLLLLMVASLLWLVASTAPWLTQSDRGLQVSAEPLFLRTHVTTVLIIPSRDPD